jgi:hypothetical protein
VTQFDPILDERLLERERAPQGKTDKVVAPDVQKVERFLDQFAAAPHAVARQVTADVEIFAQAPQTRAAGL